MSQQCGEYIYCAVIDERDEARAEVERLQERIALLEEYKKLSIEIRHMHDNRRCDLCGEFRCHVSTRCAEIDDRLLTIDIALRKMA